MNKYKASTIEEKREKVQLKMREMEQAIESYFTTPTQMGEYLAFMAKMYQYSPTNVAMIQKQFSGAKAVGSFKFWKDKGFSVQRGEQGIEIFVPNKSPEKFKNQEGKWRNIKYATPEEKQLIKENKLEHKKGKIYFTIGHVFDISQTNAKASDLPAIFPNRWLEGNVNDYDVLMTACKKIATDLNVSVGDPLDELGSAKGAFYYSLLNTDKVGHIGLNPRNSELQNVKTMLHELAHAKLHSGKKAFQLSDEEKEFQAEMVAFTVASYFDIDTTDYSLQYLANWTQNKELKEKTKLLNEVRETAVSFIQTVEEELMKNKALGMRVQLNTNQILNQFYEDCVAFWQREKEQGYVDTQTPEELALSDIRAITTNPFSPKGDVLDIAIKDAWVEKKRDEIQLQKEARDSELENMWLALEDVPFDEIDTEMTLSEDWQVFKKGTTREEIWKWFDVRYSKGLVTLMQGETKQKEYEVN